MFHCGVCRLTKDTNITIFDDSGAVDSSTCSQCTAGQYSTLQGTLRWLTEPAFSWGIITECKSHYFHDLDAFACLVPRTHKNIQWHCAVHVINTCRGNCVFCMFALPSWDIFIGVGYLVISVYFMLHFFSKRPNVFFQEQSCRQPVPLVLLAHIQVYLVWNILLRELSHCYPFPLHRTGRERRTEQGTHTVFVDI